MADIFGSNFTKTRQVPPQNVDSTDWKGRVRAMYDSYDVANDPSAGDLLFFARIPSGARVVDGWLKTPAMGTGGSFKVGRAGTNNDDNLLAATNVSSASFTRFNGSDVGNKFDDAQEFFVTITNEGTATTGTIEVCIMYVVD